MEINNPVHRWQLLFEGEWPTAVAFLGNGRIAAGNRLGEIYLWDLPESPPPVDNEAKDPEPPDTAPLRKLVGHTNGISHLRSTADGKLLISASLDGNVRLWNVDATPTGTVEVILNANTREKEARYKSKEEQEKIRTAPGITLETIDAEHVLEKHQGWVISLGLSRDEKRIITGDVNSQIVVWDLETRQEIASWSGHPWNWMVAAALSPDGQRALVSEYRYKRDDFDIPAAGLKIWSVADKTEILDLLKVQFPKLDPEASTYGSAQLWRKFVAGGLIAADYSPDGKIVAVGQGGETDTGQVHLLDADSGKLLRTVSGHKNGICDVKFSADGKLILSSGRDTMVRICQVEDGKEIAKLGESRGGQFKDWISAFVISPDQKFLATADIAGMVHVWQLS